MTRALRNRMTNTKTVIEQVVPVQNSKPVRLDAWRWLGVPTFEQYRDMVLARSYPAGQVVSVKA